MDLLKYKEFDWDKGNRDKNWEKHKVANYESEQIFLNSPLLFHYDMEHSTEREKRYFSLGHTNQFRLLAVSFTLRKNKIRIISARDMSGNERKIYGKEIKKYT